MESKLFLIRTFLNSSSPKWEIFKQRKDVGLRIEGSFILSGGLFHPSRYARILINMAFCSPLAPTTQKGSLNRGDSERGTIPEIAPTRIFSFKTQHSIMLLLFASSQVCDENVILCTGWLSLVTTIWGCLRTQGPRVLQSTEDAWQGQMQKWYLLDCSFKVISSRLPKLLRLLQRKEHREAERKCFLV